MINIDNLEKFVTEELAQGEHFSLRKEGWIELVIRLRQAEKLNAELKDRMSHIGMDVGIATTGQVPGDHPIKSRLEMVAKLAKDAARYRWLRDEAIHSGKDAPLVIMADECGRPIEINKLDRHILDLENLDIATDEAMQCK